MRLIDADSLDEKLDVLMVRYAALGRRKVAEDYNFVRTVLLTAPTIEVPRWIPVAERLPTEEDANNDGFVLALNGHKIYNLWHKSDFEEHPEWFVHWMSLPDAPKDGE